MDCHVAEPEEDAQDEEDARWEDWEEDEDAAEPCLCLLCAARPASAEACVAHMRADHGWDVAAACRALALDDYGIARLVNLLRRQPAPVAPEQLLADAAVAERLRTDEELLRPVLPSDPLLYELEDIVAGVSKLGADAAPQPANDDLWTAALDPAERQQLVQAADAFPAVRKLLDELRRQAASATAAAARVDALERSYRNYREMSEAVLREEDTLEQLRAEANEPLPADAHAAPGKMDQYFSSYSHYGIHEEMLKDDIRTISYGYFIDSHRDAFKDKVVLDVGCGTGILSMFAAKAGARKVYAVDASGIIVQAQQNVLENGLGDRIETIRGKMEELVLPEKVDVIISEWMGYFLLFESMLDTVLLARDRWLRPGGRVFPVQCAMKIAGLDHVAWTHERLDYWDNVYGFKMSAMKPLLYEDASVEHVDQQFVSTDVCTFKTIDAEKVQVPELEFTSSFRVKATTAHTLNAFTTYFDVDFDPSTTHAPTRFTTGPFGDATHWKQTLLYLKVPLKLFKDDVVEGTLSVRRQAENTRTLAIDLTYGPAGAAEIFSQSYTLV